MAVATNAPLLNPDWPGSCGNIASRQRLAYRIPRRSLSRAEAQETSSVLEVDDKVRCAVADLTRLGIAARAGIGARAPNNGER